MASTSQVRDDTPETGRAHGGVASISAHPAFPLVLALWFAALLGLGSLVLPATLVEQAVIAIGIAAAVPAAAPPLGFTAHAVIALAATVLGALVGLFIARKFARPAPDQPRRRSFRAEENPRRLPLSPRQELGSDSFDSVAGFATARRRALAVDEESRKSDFLVFAPLPGQRHEQVCADAESGKVDASQPDASSAAEETFDLEECAEFTEVNEADLQDGSPEEAGVSEMRAVSLVPGRPAAGEPLRFSPPSMAARPPMTLLLDDAEEIELATFEEDDGAAVPEAPEEKEYFGLQETPQERPQDCSEEEPKVDLAPQPEPEPEPEPEREPETEIEPGLVELVQKLGETLEKYREWTAQRIDRHAAPSFPRAVAAAEFGAGGFGAAELSVAAPAEAARAMAAFFAPEQDDAPAPASADASADRSDRAASEAEQLDPAPERQRFIPLSTEIAVKAGRLLRPFAGFGPVVDAEDDEDIAELAASFSLPLGRDAVPAAGGDAEGKRQEPGAPADEVYSSLLGMRDSFRNYCPEFVPVEKPQLEPDTAQPAVVFPREVPAAGARQFDRSGAAGSTWAANETIAPPRPAVSNDDNDRVLREALMNLQRTGKN